jgi:hypothetical protein
MTSWRDALQRQGVDVVVAVAHVVTLAAFALSLTVPDEGGEVTGGAVPRTPPVRAG